MKILIAVPTFENIYPEVFEAIYNLDKCGHEVNFKSVKGYDCAKARNVISKKAIDGGYDYVMMVDSDTVIPKTALRDMLDPEADIVMGCYPRKNTTTGEAVLWSLKENPIGKGFTKPMHYDELQGTERIALKGGGFGCVLISSQVYTALTYPYFKYVVYEKGTALSEDLYFCREVLKKGFDIWCDPRVKCGHMAKRLQYE